MAKQIQIKRQPPKRPTETSDAPTVNDNIARTWFQEA
jgi:hypothetical protein